MSASQGDISITPEQGLCVSCGLCVAVCPEEAISWTFRDDQHIPVVKETCNQCGLCLHVCPGIKIDLALLSRLVRSESVSVSPKQLIAGRCSAAYVAHAEQPSVRLQGTSGGVVTQLLINGLQNGFRHCFVVGPVKRKRDRLELALTDTAEGILSAAGSKYLPVSAEQVGRFLQTLRREKAIIVGLPCQIYGLHRLAELCDLTMASVIFLGLFCERTLSHGFLDFIERQYGSGDALSGFRYRTKEAGGWPGHMHAQFGKRWLIIDRRIRLALKSVFTLKRCLYCFDKFNVLADIALGDCYIRGKSDEQGLSNMLVRTDKGSLFLEQCQRDLFLAPEIPDIILQSQNILGKMACFWAGKDLHIHSEVVETCSYGESVARKLEAVHQNLALLEAVRRDPQLPWVILRRARLRHLAGWPRVFLAYILRLLRRAKK